MATFKVEQLPDDAPPLAVEKLSEGAYEVVNKRVKYVTENYEMKRDNELYRYRGYTATLKRGFAPIRGPTIVFFLPDKQVKKRVGIKVPRSERKLENGTYEVEYETFPVQYSDSTALILDPGLKIGIPNDGLPSDSDYAESIPVVLVELATVAQ